MKQNSSTDCLCNCCLQILGRKSLFSSYQHIALSITSVHASIRAYLLFTGPTLFLQKPGSEAGGRRWNKTSFVQHSRCNGCVPFSLSHWIYRGGGELPQVEPRGKMGTIRGSVEECNLSGPAFSGAYLMLEIPAGLRPPRGRLVSGSHDGCESLKHNFIF